MTLFRKTLTTLAAASLVCAVAASAVFNATAQPMAAADSAFYVQINLLEMRQSQAGSQLYDWVEDEVLDDLEDEFGADFITALDGISVFGAGEQQAPVILVHGFLAPDTRDMIIAKLFDENDSAVAQSRHGQTFYAVDADSFETDSLEINGKDIDNLFLAFGADNQTMITPSEDALDEFLRNGSFFENTLSPELIVVQANRPLLQGGLNTKHQVFKHGPWESKFFQNVEQVGLVIADAGDDFEIRAQAVSQTPSMAEALGSIAKGLLSFKALAEEDGDDLSWLNNLDVSSSDNTTTFQLLIPARQLLDAID